ncbi:hypothetical protein [Jiella sp. M17.18]|uniref:hypothetical protein n=1 Tax=Jiella sp. M17.18 TaxID=3234247 RepID=UPI0034DE867B
MFAWLSEHSAVVNLAINAAMLCVWIVYLQLLLNSHRRQRRPSIVITRGAGSGLHSRCLITNMSAEAIYVTSLIATLVTKHDRVEFALTDLRDLPEDLGTDPRSAMRQGSLMPGSYLDIGHFDDLVGALSEADHRIADKEEVETIEIIAVALYGPERDPVGAERHFDLRRDGERARILPRTVETHQMHSRRKRRQLAKKLAEHM